MGLKQWQVQQLLLLPAKTYRGKTVEYNPYAPPRADLSMPPEPPGALDPASKTRRIINLLVDAIGYYTLSMVVGLVIALVDPPLIEAATSYPATYVVGIAVVTLYYVPSEALFGRTLGKLVTGTRLVSESGGAPTFGQVLGRTFARFIPFEPVTFLGRSGVGLHDRLSRTRVVRIRRPA